VDSKKKILLISQVFYPDEVAVANLFTNLCSVLVKNGEIKIDVWCAQPSYTCLKRQPRYRNYEGINIHYLRSTNFHKDLPLGRAINYLTFSLSVVFKLIFLKGKQLVFSHTVPPFLAIIIAFICRIKSNRFTYVLLDIFPDGLIRLNKVSAKNIFIVIWRRLHLSAFKSCHRIVVIGRDMLDWLKTIYPEGVEKMKYIPLWQDDELIKTIVYTDNHFVEKHGLLKKFVVQYSGNMGLWNDMKTFGQAVNLNLTDVFFLFIGGGMRKKELQNSFDIPNPDNALLLPFLPNIEYASSVSACHIALVSFRKGLEGMAVPSKIIGIMASGIPVIAMVPAKSEIAYIVNEEKCGIVVEPEDLEGLVGAILKLKNDEKLLLSLGLNGRNAFEKKYTTNIISKRYLELISETEKN
jgi:colanic acid biosynthesis glycosyl transferase WcaI